MKEVSVIKYQSFDGIMFDSKQECIEYEKTCEPSTPQVIEAINVINKLCKIQNDCDKCAGFSLAMGDCMFTSTAPNSWLDVKGVYLNEKNSNV